MTVAIGECSGSGSGPAGSSYRRNMVKAVLCLLVTALTVPGVNAIVKLLSQDFSVVQLLWVRYAGHFVLMIALFLPRHGLGMFRANRPLLQTLRSVLFLLGSLFVFLAMGSVSLPIATSIQFTAPLLVTLLAPVLLNEKVFLVRYLLVVLGFAGALVVLRPDQAPLSLAAGSLLLSAVWAALGQVISRKLAAFDRPLTSATYMVIPGMVVTSLMLPFSWRWPQDAKELLLLVALGTLGGMGQYCLMRAFELAAASFVAPFLYLQIIGAALLGFLLFDQAPDLTTIVGAGIIIVSGVLVMAQTTLSARVPKPTVPL
ncbi:DMT family transporter [Agrobacterium rubi]|uniref:DMT family transporter n=1 Tax=Agrobacterium rubi TaxID=28099 RepID=UPI0015739E52|nr:DMT family transporter [Agrobacterium rubi]NTF10485.1 DMT family transporter [Agrobacterium rubi]NTF22879.1 DMT family transporter [Agrobacterium rubi]NTF29810.1 DMT family transporter [Agrobacterium rubi]